MSAPEMRLHLEDSGDATRRADEVMTAYCDLLAKLGAPGYRVTGYRMHCDGCDIAAPDQHPTFGEARAASRAQGWVTVGADDYCPSCKERALTWLPPTPTSAKSHAGASEAGQIETCEICDTEESELDDPEDAR